MAQLAELKAGLKLGWVPTVVAAVAALYFAQDVLIPLALAVLLTFLLVPVVTGLERLRLGRVGAVLLAVIIALASLGTIGWLIEQQFVEVAGKLPDYRENIQSKLRRFRGVSDGSLSKAARGVEYTLKTMADTAPATAPSVNAAAALSLNRPGTAALPEVSPENPLPVREYSQQSSPMQLVGRSVVRLTGPMATTGLIIVFVIFMLLNRKDLRDRMIRLVGHGRLNVTTQALDDAATRISRYLLMQSAINGIYGVCVGAGLWIIGVGSAEGHFPNVLLWALLAAVLRFVPYLGPIIGATVPVVLSLAAFNSTGVFAATLCLYVILELVTSNVLEPWLYGARTGLSVMAILVSAVFWTWLWGPIGLLLSTPLTVCLVVLGKHVPHLEFLSVVLGDEPVLEPYARVYQRLLSLDQEEASDLLHGWRKEKGLEYVYDDVMIPALATAEKDRGLGELDPEREAFVRQAMRDLIEELGDAQEEEENAEASFTQQSSGAASIVRPLISQEPPITILCLPAHNEADEIVGLMLAQLLQFKGQRVVTVSQVSLAGEILELVAQHGAAAVCISALPPAALAHCRYLSKRLSARFPDLPAVAGLWTSRADPKKSRERLGHDGSMKLVTSLADAIAELHQVVQPLLLAIAAAKDVAKPGVPAIAGG